MRNYFFLVPIVILVHLSILLTLRFIAWPEMILWPYFLLEGWLPYRDVAVAHSPLLIVVLAGFYKIFGVSLESLRLFVLIFFAFVDFFLFWVVYKISKSQKTALISLIFFVFWQPYFEGNGIWFDFFLAPLFLLVFYLLRLKKFLFAGLILGLCLLFKQTAVFGLIPVGLMILLERPKIKDLISLSLGIISPLLLTGLIFYSAGILDDFIFWAIKFGTNTLPTATGQVQLPTLKQLLGLTVPFGLILPYFLESPKDKKRLILISWAVFTGFGIYPRWSLFHLQPALPFLSMISGFVIAKYLTKSNVLTIFQKRKYFWIIFLLFIVYGTLHFQIRFYWQSFMKDARFFEKETLVMADWLKDNTNPGDKIFILNSWDHLYALSGTLPSVKPWVPTLAWVMEYENTQKMLAGKLIIDKPELVVFEPYYDRGWGSGLGNYKPKDIDDFLQKNYKLDEVVAGRFWILRTK